MKKKFFPMFNFDFEGIRILIAGVLSCFVKIKMKLFLIMFEMFASRINNWFNQRVLYHNLDF